jgi:hypothetical protein
MLLICDANYLAGPKLGELISCVGVFTRSLLRFRRSSHIRSSSQTDWYAVRTSLASRLQTVIWDRVIADVRPFLDQNADHGMLTRENILKLLGVAPRKTRNMT